LRTEVREASSRDTQRIAANWELESMAWTIFLTLIVIVNTTGISEGQKRKETAGTEKIKYKNEELINHRDYKCKSYLNPNSGCSK
jgi:hypothetical protein